MRSTLILTIICLALATPSPLVAIGLPAGSSVVVSARADYSIAPDEWASAEASATLSVRQVASSSITLNGEVVQAVPGEICYIPVRVTNTGNGSDSYQLSVQSSNGWSVSLARDDNADGIHQDGEDFVQTETGLLVADGYSPCFAIVTVPPDASGSDNIMVRATSSFGPVGGGAVAGFGISMLPKTPTSLSVAATPNPAYPGQTATMSGAVSPAIECQFDLTITVPSGDPVTAQVETAADGSFSTTLAVDHIGQYGVNVVFKGDDTYAGCSADSSLSADAKIQAALSAAVAQLSPSVGDTAAVSGALTPALQTSLHVTCTDPTGSVTQSDISTNLEGLYSWQHGVDAPGNWSVTVSYVGSVSHEPASRTIGFTVDVPHDISFTNSPLASPATVDSGNTAACSAVAVDSRGHSVTYHWSDGGAGGSFSPNGDTQGPTYTAPTILGGPDVQVTLSCTASCAQSEQQSATFGLTVKPVPVPPAIVRVEPRDVSTDVALSSSIVIEFDSAMNRQATQPAIVSTPPITGAVFTWSSQDHVVTITHQDFAADTSYSLVVRSSACGIDGMALASDYGWTFHTVHPAPTCVVTGPASPTGSDHFTFTIEFSEPVTGLSVHGIAVIGASKGDLAGTGASYTLPVTASADGAVSCRVAGEAAHNATGQGNTASNTPYIVYDGTPPDVVITTPTTATTCLRTGLSLILGGTASNGVDSVTWANETTGASGQCAGTLAWSAEGIPVVSGENTITVTAVDAVGNSSEAQLVITSVDVDPNALADAWHGTAMVSVPIIPDRTDPKQVVGFSQQKWCEYHPTMWCYAAYPIASTWFNPRETAPGRGFWAVFDDPGSVPAGTLPPQDRPMTIHLYPGWNLVGEPFLSPVQWNLAGIMVRDRAGKETSLGECTYVATRALGWQQGKPDSSMGAYYPVADASVDADAAHEMLPWRAYWIAALRECDLILSPPGAVEATSTPATRRPGMVRPSSHDLLPGPPSAPH